MDRRTLFLKMLPGLLPLVVFVLIDEVWGIEAGLVAALGFALVELVWTRIRERRFEKFVLVDLLLLGVLGGVSLLLKDAVFFKLKPAILAVLVCGMLGVAGFVNPRLLTLMAGRALRGTALPAAGERLMQLGARRMFWVFLLYTALCFYAAFAFDTRSWGIVTGPGFFAALGLALLWQLAAAWHERRRVRHDEWFDLVDEEGRIIGAAPRSLVHGRPELLHPVVHLHVFSADGRLLLQKRAPWKDVQPDKWDTAVGGHIARGESVAAALVRESREEIGIDPVGAVPLFRYVNRTEFESELVHAFALRHEGPFTAQASELTELRFCTREELAALQAAGGCTPNFVQELAKLEALGWPGRHPAGV